jgi:hypothetical protein
MKNCPRGVLAGSDLKSGKAAIRTANTHMGEGLRGCCCNMATVKILKNGNLKQIFCDFLLCEMMMV